MFAVDCVVSRTVIQLLPFDFVTCVLNWCESSVTVRFVLRWPNACGRTNTGTYTGGRKGSQRLQPWAETRGHSTAMGRPRASQNSHGPTQGSQYSHGQTQGSQYSHGQTQGVTVQPWADTRGHSTAMGRHRGSHYSHGQTQGSQYSHG